MFLLGTLGFCKSRIDNTSRATAGAAGRPHTQAQCSAMVVLGMPDVAEGSWSMPVWAQVFQLSLKRVSGWKSSAEGPALQKVGPHAQEGSGVSVQDWQMVWAGLALGPKRARQKRRAL